MKTGLLIDNRHDFEKSKDYKFEETVSSFNVLWKSDYKDRYFFEYNQSSSLSCTTLYSAIIQEFLGNGIRSRRDVYRRRVNFSGGGMFSYDMMRLTTSGMATEKTLPSQSMNESKMNQNYAVTTQIIQERAESDLEDNYLTFDNPKDIDALAKAITSRPIYLLVFFDEAGREWWREEPINIFNFKDSDKFTSKVTRHLVVGVDYFMENGKKYILIQDSAGIGTGIGKDKNLRKVSADFIFQRCYEAGVILGNNVSDIKKPIFNVNKVLRNGDNGDDVKQLQAVLIHEGLLKIEKPTGLFRGMTLKAVIGYQERYRKEILEPLGLKRGTGIVARRTLDHMRGKYMV
jgi:hypothetical protein